MRKTFLLRLFVALIGFLPFSLYAHNELTGKVLSEDNSGLYGASIVIKGSNTGTISDEWGDFVLVTDKESGTLIISYIGYRSQEITFTSTKRDFIIELKTAIIDLKDLTINATPLSPLTSIAQVDINVRNVNSSQDILRVVPGLFIAQHAGGGKSDQIFLRGFDTDHGTDVKVSVDGLPVNMVSQAHGQGYADLHWIIPELIKDVDYGKGPYNANQGDFATAGFADFKTHTSLEENSIKLEGGQFNSFRALAMLNLLSKKQRKKGKSAFIAMDYSTTDGAFENPQNFNRFNAFARYNQMVNKNNMLTISASAFKSVWDQSGQIPQSAVDEGLVTRWGSLDPTEGGNTSRYNVSINSLSQIHSNSAFKNLIYYTYYDFDLYSNFTFFLEDTINGDQIRQREARNLFGYTGSYTQSYHLENDSKMEMELGAGLRYDDINGSQLLHTKQRAEVIDTSNYGDINQMNANIFGELSWLKNKWVFNVGLRFDLFDWKYLDKTNDIAQLNKANSTILNPKINIVYKAFENYQLYLKLGRGFHSNDAKVTTRNDSLAPLAQAYGSDLGVYFKPSSRLIIHFCAWYLYLQSELVWSGDAGTWEPNGQTNRFGLDASLRWQIVDYLYFDMDINYALARFIDAPSGENYVPLSPILTSTGGLTFKNNSPWSASLRYRFMSDRPADETNSVVALGYFVMDASLNYRLNKWLFGVSAGNVLNTEWNEAQFAGEYRSTPDREEQYGLTLTPGSPFFGKVSIQFAF